MHSMRQKKGSRLLIYGLFVLLTNYYPENRYTFANRSMKVSLNEQNNKYILCSKTKQVKTLNAN